MQLPPGFYQAAKDVGKVCKLVKSIYGLKQASRQWFARFSQFLIRFGFIASMNDYSLFTLTRGADFIVLLVYVDDVILTSTSVPLIEDVKAFLHVEFQIKDLGDLSFFLGLEVTKVPEGLFLNQRKYALELLDDAGFLDSKPAKTLMDPKHRLNLSTTPSLLEPLSYRKLVGKLIYLTISRPDLAYPVHILSQFMSSPTEEPLQVVHRVLRYIKCALLKEFYFPQILI